MKALEPVLMILAVYLLFVLKIGPAFMRKREAYKLTNTLLVYNIIQVAISAFLVKTYFQDLWSTGLVPKTCHMERVEDRKYIVTHMYFYFAAKITELLDTVFFVLRKKDNQVTFLHLYHHTCMVLGTFATLKYFPSHNLLFIGFINSLVHVFMYTYYGLAALGPNVAKYLTWKKYMTSFQLVQFVSIIAHHICAVKISDCPPSSGINTFISCNTFFFLILFSNFYRKSYKKPKTSGKSIENYQKDKSQ
ncbi:very long chain fatty acid elongase 4-like isoform X2 [Plodia interpunctella]|nr:elongation of very long chain fatty acids protein 4-like isoform X2 [Plodia interpunctella]